MKRNQRTQAVAPRELNPLTEHILGQMGPEGADIRRRLQSFYGQRAFGHLPPEKKKRGSPALPEAS